MKVIDWSLSYLSLFKLRITALLLVTGMVGAIAAGIDNFLFSQLALFALSGSMACAGASVLNNYFDRDIDAKMPRTRNRLLVVNPGASARILALGLVTLVVSLLLALRLGFLFSLFLGLGAFIYVVLYTMWLKRRTSLNIVIGGFSGSCAVLAGWFAITSELSPIPFLMALIVFLWTPSHFWSFAIVHRESYQEARIPMLPVILGTKETAGFITLHSALLLLACLILYLVGPLVRLIWQALYF